MTDGISKTKRCLASYSVFRELYDHDKDVYGILSEFIKDAIIEDGKHDFPASEIVRLLDLRYGFIIPEAVIKNAIRRIPGIKRENYSYHIEIPIKKSDEVEKKMRGIAELNDIIIAKLYAYIGERIGRGLTEQDRADILESFAQFIFDMHGGNSKYQKLISAFILLNEKDEIVTKALNCAKEGVILYSGLQYTPEEYSTSKWDSELVLFLDTEILFSIVGYNGSFYKAIANDLIKLVKEANDKSNKAEKKDIISLFYFAEIAKEIDDFFSAAQHRLGEARRPIETKPAMMAIMDGCKTKSDIIEKRTRFDQTLAYWGIRKDPFGDYFEEQNQGYNFGGKDSVRWMKENLSRCVDENDIEYCLGLLSKINILRKDKRASFETAKYYLVTANGMYHECSKRIATQRGYDASLTTSIDFLTDKLWVKMNKGFAKDSVPKSFSVITKAQAVIASQIHTSVAAKYKELELELRDNKIDETTANLSLAQIRQRNINPESINAGNVEEMVRFTEEGLAAVIQEQEFQKSEYERVAGEVGGLKIELENVSGKLKKYEAKEEQKQRRIKKLKKIGRAIVFVCCPIVVLGLAAVVILNKEQRIVGVGLGVISIIGTVLGFLKYFGYDFEVFKRKITKMSEERPTRR